MYLYADEEKTELILAERDIRRQVLKVLVVRDETFAQRRPDSSSFELSGLFLCLNLRRTGPLLPEPKNRVRF
jgi:hypothetical protein